ncbi:MAG: hypothetical protein GX557_15035, partial [Chloroflexi bacterium]|nr:hypothetical protein [Chloroflexota bacterium]
MDYEKLRQRVRELALAGDRAALEAYTFPQGHGREWLALEDDGLVPYCERGRAPAEVARLLSEYTKREYQIEVVLADGRARVPAARGWDLERRVDLFVAAIMLRREERKLPRCCGDAGGGTEAPGSKPAVVPLPASLAPTPAEIHALDLRGHRKPIKRGHLRVGGRNPGGDRLDVTSYYLEWNGVPWLPTMGEFAFSRYPAAEWEEELVKMRRGCIRVISSYLFWIHHEELEGVYDWSGSRDLRRFVELCHKHGLWVLLRIGPFAHGECRNGGLPDWLYARPVKVRSNDPGYLAYVARYFDEMGRQLRGLMFGEGGPIIGLQLDNEFMNTGAPWELAYRKEGSYFNAGSGGVAHMRHLRRLARAAGLDAPLFTATAWGSPIIENEMLPVWGGCGYLYKDWHTDPNAERAVVRAYELGGYPFITHEMTSGMLNFYTYRPALVYLPEHTTAAYNVALGSGSNWLGTYVYHGGTNPVGARCYLNEWTVPRLSYDFQAPIREYGQTLAS